MRAESLEVLFPLVAACKAGDLEFVAAWIAAGKPLDPPDGKRSRRRSPLEVAVEKGFLTLAKTLLKAGADPLANGNALEFAVSCGRVDLARLFLDHGVDVNTVRFVDVCYRENPDMIRLFIERGADVVTDDPLFEALTSFVRPFLGVFKEYRDRFPDWQRQLNRALLHHVRRDSPKNVALLVWAGAQPEMVVTDREGIEETALEAAALKGNLEIIKLLKPDQHPQLLGKMLRATWLEGSIPVADCLIGLGAKLNDQPQGGSDLLATTIRHRLEDWPGGVQRADGVFPFIEHLCRLGAKWVCPGAEGVKSARHSLRGVPPERLLRLTRIVLETKAVEPEFLSQIFSTPGMQKRLGAFAEKIELLIHPPAPKKIREPEKTPSAPAPVLSLAEVRARARQWLLTTIVVGGRRPFQTLGFSEVPTPKFLRSRLGLAKNDERDLDPIMTAACDALNRELSTLQFRYSSQASGWRHSIAINLAGTAEWSDAFREVSAALDEPASHWLTPIGKRLLDLITSGEIGPEIISERDVDRKVGLGLYQNLNPYLAEVKRESGGTVHYERVQAAGQEPALRFQLRDSNSPPSTKKAAPNPPCTANLAVPTKSDFDQMRTTIETTILSSLRPVAKEVVTIYRISTRQQLQRCFPTLSLDANVGVGSRLAAHFSAVPLHPSLQRAYDFQDDAIEWHFSLKPASTWEESLKAIEVESSGPSLEASFGISAAAALLLNWLRRLEPRRLETGWSPPVEDSNTREIGLKPLGGNENFAFFLQTLVEEINELTPYRLKTFSWTEYSRPKTRLKLTDKQTGLDNVVREIQWLAIQQGTLLDQATVKSHLDALLSGPPPPRCDRRPQPA